nr:MAG TPA: AAA domain protein [Bacteriophage sp.]
MINIKKGKIKTPITAAIYGVEGVGKTTLAAAMPGALILDVENGSGNYDVARVTGFEDLPALYGAMKDLIDNAAEYHRQGFYTVVVDTVDAVENLLMVPYVLKAHGHEGGTLADFDWGRGYELEAAEFNRFLRAGNALNAAGYNVMYIAHCSQKVVNPPDNPPYSHYEISLNKRPAALLKERVDMLLFATYETYVTKEGTTNKAKGSKRVLVCAHAAYADAKNRVGLPDRVDLDPARITPFFVGPAK